MEKNKNINIHVLALPPNECMLSLPIGYTQFRQHFSPTLMSGAQFWGHKNTI
jgi:hypothetical protein